MGHQLHSLTIFTPVKVPIVPLQGKVIMEATFLK